MPELVTIQFVADTSALQPAIDSISKITQADKGLEEQFKKSSAAMNQQMNKQVDSSKVARVSIDQLSQSVKDLNKEVLSKALSEQTNKFKEAGDKARELKNQVNDLLKTVQAGSLQSFNEKLSQARKALDATTMGTKQFAAALAEYKKAEKEATEAQIRFNQEIGKTAPAKTLVTQLRQLKQELSLMETAGLGGSKSFQDLSIKAAKLED